MKRIATVALVFTLASGPAHAHHSRANFDVTRNITYRGVVKAYRWENPHSGLVVTVAADANDKSTVGTWNIEASSLIVMTSGGWTPHTFKPGDPITVVAHPNRDGSKDILLFYVILPTGQRLYRAAHRYPGEVERKAPFLSDAVGEGDHPPKNGWSRARAAAPTCHPGSRTAAVRDPERRLGSGRSPCGLPVLRAICAG